MLSASLAASCGAPRLLFPPQPNACRKGPVTPAERATTVPGTVLLLQSVLKVHEGLLQARDTLGHVLQHREPPSCRHSMDEVPQEAAHESHDFQTCPDVGAVW